MATHVPYGADIIDVLGGGAPDMRTQNWLTERSAHVRQLSDPSAAAFFERAGTMYAMIDETRAEQMRRNLKERGEQLWSTGDIRPLYTLQGLQTASPVMQRWVMAHPDLRERYFDQALDGYAGQYENIQGDTSGEDQYDYRRVMDGVVRASENTFHLQHFYDHMSDEDSELTLSQKIDILNTWDRVSHYLEHGDEDPTSVEGNLL